MNINEEKNYIYSIINELIKERRSLTEEIYLWKERLNELNSLEELGFNQLNAVGMVEMKNSNINKIKKENLKKEFISNKKEIEKTIPKNLIEIEKDKDYKIKHIKNDINYLTTGIVNVLKEIGRPAKLSEIREELENKLDTKIKHSNFSNNIMPRAMKIDNRINRPHRGYYQYLNRNF